MNEPDRTIVGLCILALCCICIGLAVVSGRQISRIEQLEIKLEGTRNYLNENKPWFDETTLDLASIHARLEKLEAPETFPEPNDPESCK